MAKRSQLPALAPDDPLSEVIGEIDASGLDVGEMRFCLGILEGLSQADAYRAADPRRAGWAKQSCQVAGSRLAAKAHVQEYLAKCRRVGAAQGPKSLDAYVAKLERLEQISVDEKQMSAAARVAELTGKALGHISPTHRDHGELPQLAPGELLATVRMRLGDEAARRMALRLGVLDLTGESGAIDGELA